MSEPKSTVGWIGCNEGTDAHKHETPAEALGLFSRYDVPPVRVTLIPIASAPKDRVILAYRKPSPIGRQNTLVPVLWSKTLGAWAFPVRKADCYNIDDFAMDIPADCFYDTAFTHWAELPRFPELRDLLTEPEESPQILHPATALMVSDFSKELAEKLLKAQIKYGVTDDWSQTHWEDQCRVDLRNHVEKGDPLDVAAYAAFCWHHGWSTAVENVPIVPAGFEDWYRTTDNYKVPMMRNGRDDLEKKDDGTYDWPHVRLAKAAWLEALHWQEQFQARVQPWMMECFGEAISGDVAERNHRFLEESLELVQACGCTASEAHQLVDYVFARPVGEKSQEVGGVMVTLAALCLAQGLDMHEAGEVELARIWTMVEQIRAKQAAKPKHSPLPQRVGSMIDHIGVDLANGTDKTVNIKFKQRRCFRARKIIVELHCLIGRPKLIQKAIGNHFDFLYRMVYE